MVVALNGNNKAHTVPLLELCFADEETTLLVLRLNPSCAGFKCADTGDYPLHSAALVCGNLNIPTSVFVALADLAPSVLAERNSAGDLPIHCAIRSGASTAT